MNDSEYVLLKTKRLRITLYSHLQEFLKGDYTYFGLGFLVMSCFKLPELNFTFLFWMLAIDVIKENTK